MHIHCNFYIYLELRLQLGPPRNLGRGNLSTPVSAPPFFSYAQYQGLGSFLSILGVHPHILSLPSTALTQTRNSTFFFSPFRGMYSHKSINECTNSNKTKKLKNLDISFCHVFFFYCPSCSQGFSLSLAGPPSSFQPTWFSSYTSRFFSPY